MEPKARVIDTRAFRTSDYLGKLERFHRPEWFADALGFANLVRMVLDPAHPDLGRKSPLGVSTVDGPRARPKPEP
jgi:hypothetical protein